MTESTELLTSDIDRVADAIRAGDRFLLTTHENPDGDALGSLLAMHRILEALGKDSVMFLAAKEFPLPVEYRFLPLEEVFHEPPADIADRVVIFLDCGNIDRMPVDFLQNGENKVINIDHHHDNTRFGSVNLVDVDASCTAEIVYDLAGLLDVQLTPEIANALYVGLVTDTGKFMYENTDARSHRMAAGLIEAGVQVNEIYRRLYEHAPHREAQAARPRAGGHHLARRRPTRGHLHLGRGLRGHRGQRGAHRGDHRSPADDRRHARGRRGPRPARQRPSRPQGEHALDRRAG